MPNPGKRGTSLCPRVHQLGRPTSEAGRAARLTDQGSQGSQGYSRGAGDIPRCSRTLCVPPRWLATINSSYRTPNVVNDLPQDLLHSNPPSFFLRLPVCRGTLPYSAGTQRPTHCRAAPEPETPGQGGRRAPPLASLYHRRRALRLKE